MDRLQASNSEKGARNLFGIEEDVCTYCRDVLHPATAWWDESKLLIQASIESL
jgi:hypothetical protein